MADSKSWFYLTLWHGTPPEFTTMVDVDISETEKAYVSVQTKDVAESAIEKQTSTTSQIADREKVGVDIIKTMEVIWVVG